MQFLAKFMGSTIAGWIGWELGKFIGLGTALTLSLVGSVVGWYYAKKWTTF